MSCSSVPLHSPTGWGPRSEAFHGSMAGMTDCGCGCSAETVEVDWMPTFGMGRGWDSEPARGRSASSGDGCALFEVPSFTGGSCKTDCSDDLDGTAAECESWIEGCATMVLTEDDLDAYATSDIPPSVHGETDTERELIQAAWSLLEENIDLVRWAICLRYGATKAERVMDRLTNNIDGTWWVGLYVMDVAFGGPFFVPPFLPTLPPSRVSDALIIVRGSDFWQDLLKMWTSGDLSSRSCAALDFAAGLAHELCHVGRYTMVDLEIDGDGITETCFTSFIIGNTVRWALFQRYPPALMGDSNCCGDKADASMFACGDTHAHFKGCAEGSGDPDESGYSSAVEGILDRGLAAIEFWIHQIISRIEWAWEYVESAVDAAWDCITNIRDCLNLGAGSSGGGGGNDPICRTCPSLCVGGKFVGGSDDDMAVCMLAIMASIFDKDSDDPYDFLNPTFYLEPEELYG